MYKSSLKPVCSLCFFHCIYIVKPRSASVYLFGHGACERELHREHVEIDDVIRRQDSCPTCHGDPVRASRESSSP
jgi:hypothetical protein